LKPRNVRMLGTHVTARLDGRPVDVANLSLSGALLKLDQDLAIDRQVTFALVRDSKSVTIDARVTRSAPLSVSSGWLVAIAFLNPSAEAKRAIPQMLIKNSRRS
jgi:hypothetical protein